MYYYRVTPAELAQRGSLGPLDATTLVLVNAETGDLLIRAQEAIPGLSKANRQAFEAVRAHVAEARAAEPRLLVTELHASSTWRVEPSSPRRAALAPAPSPSGGPALRIELGGGKGDTIRVGRPLRIPAEARGLRLSVRALLPEGEALSIGAVLTTEAERPWLEVAAQEVAPGGARELSLDLSGLDEKKRARADRLVLVIVSDADSGAVLVDRLAVIG